MNIKTFNENFEIDRRAKCIKAMPKRPHAELPEILTADGAAYDANQIYYFFDEQTREVRQSLGLRCDGTNLCMFGLRVVAVASLRANRDSALTDGQAFFKLQIENLQDRIQSYELENAVKENTSL